ncbi:MAG: FtsK/SpoIIIE domain-containing protein [Rhodoglobus sp.]
MAGTESTRIVAPRPPEPRPPFRLPIFATIAPMIAAIVMWRITGSPFALMFAALGPVTAVASLADSRVGSRRARARQHSRFELELLEARGQIASEHARERLSAAEVTPTARAIVGRTGADPYRWRATTDREVSVCVGVGVVGSDVEVERVAGNEAPAFAAALAELASMASVLDAAPVAVDARLGIGAFGPAPLAAAVARALALQLAWTLSPAKHWLRGAESDWMSLLPHPKKVGALRAGTVAEFGIVGEDRALITIAAAGAEALLPGSCGVVLRVGGEEGSAILQHPDRAQRRSVRVEPLSLNEAGDWALLASIEAAREGIATLESLLPSEVRLGELPRGSTEGLACAVAADGEGPVALDLVAQGPHAVIGGTTGSGKSELLISWIVAMAGAHPPEQLTFLLVDFKGGSAFALLGALPHTAGIITDLDAAQAARALASLRAELRYRERMLADAAARDVDDLPGLPRLVIVVDEFAAMLVDHPDLHALFADIAARGRSLGVHLILCTQRPAGVVRDAVLANADLRISLRVNNRADSSAVVGSDAAASIPALARGRGILAPADSPPRLVQFAIASPADVDAAARFWPESQPIRRPWCDPLPTIVPLQSLDAGAGIAFGLLDLPGEQRIDVAVWHPIADGHILVLGAPGSGKSTALAAFGAHIHRPGAEDGVAPVVWLPATVDAAWDMLAQLAETRDRIVLVDDLDSLLPRIPADHRATFVDRLAALLRDGPARGIRLVLAAQRLAGEVQSLAALAPIRLLLAQSSRQEFVLAGGDGAQYVEGLPPGGGTWRGARVQVATGAPRRPDDSPALVAAASGRPLAIVSSRAAALAGRLQSIDLSSVIGDPAAQLALDSRAVLGDVDEWQSRWGAIAALRPIADILFDGCSVADYRALTRSRELPPPLTGVDMAWRLEPDGTASRVRLPAS